MTDRILIGEPFKAPAGGPDSDAWYAVYQIGNYGRRIVPVKFTGDGQLKPSRVRNCVHAKPLIPRLFTIGVDDYAQICQLCAFEAPRLGP